MLPEATGPSCDGRVCDKGGLRLSFGFDPQQVRGALADLRARWLAGGLSAATCERAELVLAEALNNVVEHAFCRAAGRIALETCFCPGCIVICLRDEGAPMPGHAIPAAGKPPDPASLPEGGFGWYLIHSLADELTYLRADQTNVLCMRIADPPADMSPRDARDD